jgi:SET domain-containing protein
MYKPLPDKVRLGFSDIHDIGLFAKEGIAQGTNLGMTHIKITNNIIRTPLGGFINHSDDANCVKAEIRMFNEDDPSKPLNYKKWNLITLRNIKKGEELTLKYTFYKI